jgi:hypothetical protein
MAMRRNVVVSKIFQQNGTIDVKDTKNDSPAILHEKKE